MSTMNQNNQDKLVFKIVSILSIVVFVAVVILNRKILPRPEVMPSWVMYLPTNLLKFLKQIVSNIMDSHYKIFRLCIVKLSIIIFIENI